MTGTTDPYDAREFPDRRPTGAGPLRLAFVVFGGTVPWTAHLIASYSVATYACGDSIATWILHGITLGAGLVAVSALLAALRLLRNATKLPKGERTPEEDRDQFLASGGVLLAGLGLMAITFGEVAVVIAGCAP